MARAGDGPDQDPFRAALAATEERAAKDGRLYADAARAAVELTLVHLMASSNPSIALKATERLMQLRKWIDKPTAQPKAGTPRVEGNNRNGSADDVSDARKVGELRRKLGVI
jgi:hypothetical protein